MANPDPRQALTEAEADAVVDAIRAAERESSGEIRVHLESRCLGLPYYRAMKLLADLGMHQTRERTAVLLYLAVVDRRFAIVGDEGIAAVVPEGFWDAARDAMQASFAAGRLGEGLVEGIRRVGAVLASRFPRDPLDVNELPDVISYG